MLYPAELRALGLTVSGTRFLASEARPLCSFCAVNRQSGAALDDPPQEDLPAVTLPALVASVPSDRRLRRIGPETSRPAHADRYSLASCCHNSLRNKRLTQSRGWREVWLVIDR